MATNVDAKLLKQTRFPTEFSQKVDMKKVNVEVMKKWIAGKISEILGNEDDVVVELCFNLLEGFLDKDTPKFCKELWTLCLSAQSNPQGVPKELLEAKKLELIQEKIDAEKAAEEAQRRRDQERMRDKNIDHIRQRERAERGVHPDTPDRHHHGGENLHTELTIVGPRRETMSIHMFLEIGIDGDVIAVIGHLPIDGLLVGLCPAQGRRRQGVTEMMIQGLGVAAMVLAGR
ncbi:MAG: hypothetical protein Q9209_000651 [Squamulea sp. 1 TL-2023]